MNEPVEPASLDRRFQRVLDAAPDAIVGVDARGTIVWVNNRCEAVFGWCSHELVGQSFEVLIPESRRAAHVDMCERYVAEPVPRPMGAGLDLEARRRDGSTFPAEISLSSLSDGHPVSDTDGDDGRELLVMAAIRDVTERKEIEAELRDAREQAAAAEIASRAKDDFLSTVSHELRTPLNAILGFAQLLERDALTSSQRANVEHINKAGTHLLGLINDLLDISSVSSGRIALSQEPVGLTEIITDTAALVAPLASSRGIVVSTESADGLHVLADRQRIKQVLLNLLANAIKYNVEGGRVAVSWDKGGPGRVRINVTDTGHGIAPDLIGRLFSPFDRLDADPAGVEGAGLGLALANALVDAMGGTLSATSEIGDGSTFTIDLPLAPSPIEQFERESRDDGAVGSRHQRAQVLCIEDNLSNVRLMEQIIAIRSDLALMPAMQGRLGIDLAKQHRPALILLDLHLPDMDGEHVLGELLTDTTTRDIPVVVMSADATPGRAQRLVDRGAVAYITKPIIIDEFLELLDKIVPRDV